MIAAGLVVAQLLPTGWCVKTSSADRTPLISRPPVPMVRILL